MANHRRSMITTGILFLVVVTTAYTIAPTGKYKNLKVLPQDISEKKMDSIMNAYNKALKVTCDFCHVKAKKNMFSIAPPADSLDYALDNPMKEDARRMIRLQIDINTKYFKTDSTIRPEYMNVVSCNTCHRGNPFPAWE